MSLLDWVRGRFGKSSPPITSSHDLFVELYGGRRSSTGKTVSTDTAIQVGAVFACVRAISEGLAQVPLHLYSTRDDGRTQVKRTDHPAYRLLYRRPNGDQTAFEFRETLLIHAALTGNARVFINKLPSGRILELMLLPSATVVRDDDGSIIGYLVTGPKSGPIMLPKKSVWDVRGPSWDGVVGFDPIKLAREAIGLAMSAEESQATLHKDGVRPSGIYTVDGTLNKEQYENLRLWILENNASEKSGGLMLLDRNAKFTPTSMTGVDAQHLETRRYQIEEICRFFRVMPIMVGYSDKAATYASAEQMFLAHVVHTLAPWAERLEQSADVNLLSEKDQAAGLYWAHDLSGLLRGAMKDTAEYLGKLTERGIMTRNEARAAIDLNPLPDLDLPLTPANMMVGTEPQPAAAEV